MKNIDVLIGCEESGIVTEQFRLLGCNAWSCDILPTSWKYMEYHIQEDIFKVIEDHPEIRIGVFFPPCTHLSVSGAKWFEQKRKDGRQQQGIDFFMRIVNLQIKHIAIENPIGIMSSIYRKPDQIIQPWEFGDAFEKKTCLWLKELPKLKPTNIVEPPKRTEYTSGKTMPTWYAEAWKLPKDERAKLRSKTFPGIAKALAMQYLSYIESNLTLNQ